MEEVFHLISLCRNMFYIYCLFGINNEAQCGGQECVYVYVCVCVCLWFLAGYANAVGALVLILCLVLGHMKLPLQSYVRGCHRLERMLHTLSDRLKGHRSCWRTGYLLASTQLGTEHILTRRRWHLLVIPIFLVIRSAACGIFLLFLGALFTFLKKGMRGKLG